MPADNSHDVVVVGAGPAGLTAAVAAAELRMRVAIVDENSRPGGQIWRSNRNQLHPNARRWIKRAERARIRFIDDASVVGVCGPQRLDIASGSTAFRITSESIVLAVGARERFLPFPGWTLPGVTGVGALQALVKGGFDIRGKRIVIAGSGPLLPAVAADLKRRGADLLEVAEQAEFGDVARFLGRLVRNPAKLWQALRIRTNLALTPIRFGVWPIRAEGSTHVERILLTDGRRVRRIQCDIFACSFGLVPNTRLARLLGCTIGTHGIEVDDLQRTDRPEVLAAGECTGIGGVDVAKIEGTIAGHSAAGKLDDARAFLGSRTREHRLSESLDSAFELRPEVLDLAEDDTIVCRCEDVAWRDIKTRNDWRTAKLGTRLGMGPCQGRVCGSAMQALRGWSESSPRPPLQPVSLTALSSLSDSTSARELKSSHPITRDGGI